MPVHNSRIVVLGVPRAGKEYQVMVNTREETQREEAELLRLAERAERELVAALKAEAAEARRG